MKKNKEQREKEERQSAKNLSVANNAVNTRKIKLITQQANKQWCF